MADILITDDLFIDKEEEERLISAGHRVERVLGQVSEDRLIEALEGKQGYILGGVERVTERVIAAATELRAIAFTGSGFDEFIPAWQVATDRGIAISASVGANARSVAELSYLAGFSQSRAMASLMMPGGVAFETTRETTSLTLGVIGYGVIGRELASMALSHGIRVMATTSTPQAGVIGKSLNELLDESDVVAIHVDKRRGTGVLDSASIGRIKPGGVLVNFAFREAIDNDALVERVAAGELRGAVDYPLDVEGLPVGALLSSRIQTGFNTVEGNKRASIRATTALLAMLDGPEIPDLANPDFVRHIDQSRR